MGIASIPRRGDVFLVDPSSTHGREIQKTRPCVIVSPEELNALLTTVIVAPMTTGAHPYLFRTPCRFAGKSGHIVLDQLGSVDASRLVRRLGRISEITLARTLRTLQEMFAA